MGNKLAIFGGPQAVQFDSCDIFKWPIITREEEDAVLEVLRNGSMSGTDLTQQVD